MRTENPIHSKIIYVGSCSDATIYIMISAKQSIESAPGHEHKYVQANQDTIINKHKNLTI